MRRHYALTLSHWSNRLEAHAQEAKANGGERRYRIWRFNLAGCACCCDNIRITTNQMLCCKLGGAKAKPSPLMRDWITRPASN